VAQAAALAVPLWLLPLVSPAASRAHGYLLPLGKEAPLTSTFGEYRTRHFHGGLDLSTGGETGLDVHAVASGYVWRLRVSGAGYGKAIYLRLDDGRTAVYGHLKDFSPRIRRVAEEVQMQKGTYAIDYFPDSDSLRVEAGEVIAYSGDTGAGPAHLHFELRDGDVELNPLTHGFQARDTLPPRVRSLILSPLGPESLVEGGGEPLSVGLRWNGGRRVYTTSRVPVLQGDVGVAARVYDLADGKPNRLAPYQVELRVDGEIAYQVVFDTVPLLSAHHVELVYNYWYAMRGSRDVINLFCAPGARVGVARDRSPWCGTLRVSGSGKLGNVLLTPGLHDIEVRALDVDGNERSAVLNVVADNRPLISNAGLDSTRGSIDLSASDPDGDRITFTVEVSADRGFTWTELLREDASSPFSGRLELPCPFAGDMIRVKATDRWGVSSPPAYFGPGLSPAQETPPKLSVSLAGGYAEVVCRLSCPTSSVPTLWLLDADAAAPVKPLRVERVSADSFRSSVPLVGYVGSRAAVMALTAGTCGPLSTRTELGIRTIRQGEETEIRYPEGPVLAVPKDGFVADAFVNMVARDTVESAGDGELVQMSRAFEFAPAEQFFDQAAALFLPLEGNPADSTRVGLYRRAGRGAWTWVGASARERNALVGGDISHFSEFVLMEDVEPPEVSRLRPRQGQNISGSKPFLEARVKDGGSGLDWDRVYFTIDGERLITAWEAEENHAWVRVPHDLPPGPHEVEFFAADRAGNETVRTVSIVVTR
jgi:murein DD-endopeptidase MepM/ murein hydrolase activator NlpD